MTPFLDTFAAKPIAMYTVYDEEEGKYTKVEDPDASLTYTYADYLKWKFEERLELFRGKIFKMGAPNTMHQTVVLNLGRDISNYLKGKTCRVFVAPYDIRLPSKGHTRDEEITTVVQPDVCVICDPSKIDERGICGAPDLVVEILSPGNSKKEIRDKYELYEEAGVKEYWVVNPSEQNIFAFTREPETCFGPPKIYTGGDRLKSRCIPGLSIEVNEIFTP